MNNTPAAHISGDDHIVVCGKLRADTISTLRKAGNERISQQIASPIKIDLEQVSYSNCCGLALLLAWTRHAKQCNKALCFINTPNQLRDLAQVSNLDKILILE
jgi:anti-anti-sigma factor